MWASQGGEIMGAVLAAAEAGTQRVVAACVDARANDQRALAYATADFRAFLSEAGKPWPRLRDDIAKHCQEHEDEVRNEIIRTHSARRKQGGTKLERLRRWFFDTSYGAAIAILVSLVSLAAALGLIELAKERLLK
jgi:hypothetical protein